MLKLTDFKFDKQIGAGASAEVYKGMYKEMDVAIKRLRFPQDTMNQEAATLTREFQREISTLIKVRHPNIVQFVGACVDKGHVLIVTEFASGGSLFSLLHEQKSKVQISWSQRYRMVNDIAKGMYFLHGQEPPILHRDLKSLNLLVSEPVKDVSSYIQIKVTDFGLSRGNSSSMDGEEASRMTGLAGTFHWMAPECLKSEDYTTKADVYSYAIVLWEIICREPPFKNLKPHEILHNVVTKSARPDMSSVPADCPKELVTIMCKCWEQNPVNRPTFKDICRGLRQIENKFKTS